MGYKYSFMDNVTYGAEDINETISRLTTSGVSVCPTEGSLIDAINTVTSEVATEGVEFNADSCAVSDAETGFIKISQGTAFFENGVTITIDEEGIVIPKEKECYVYLYHDFDANTCYAATAAELPEQRYVPLAFIDSDGTITDKRIYAKNKLAPSAPGGVFRYVSDVPYGMYEDGDKQPIFSMNVGHPNAIGVGFDNSGWYSTGFGLFEENGSTPYVQLGKDIAAYIRFAKVGNEVEVYVKPFGSVKKVVDVEFVVF